MKLPAFQPQTKWQMPRVHELPSWTGARRICVDLETKDPQLTTLGPGVRRDGRVVGVGFAIEDGPAAYLPIGHAHGPNLDPSLVWRYLKDQARQTKAEIVTANGQYDHDYLLENGVDFLHCPWFDVQIADPLIDELQESYSLENIARRHGVEGKAEEILRRMAGCWGVDPKKGLWQLPARAVGEYGEQDCRSPLAIAERQRPILERMDLQRVFQLEQRLQPVLLKMRRRGVAIDFTRLERVEVWALQKEQESLDEVARRVGVRLSTDDTNKTAAWVPVMERIGVRLPKTAQGKDSLTKEILASLDHPVADLVRATKKYNKLRTTFCASARRHAVKGRIHCTFNQLRRPRDEETGDEAGARYGRLSCVDPNLQQQPSPDRDPEIGRAIRGIFVPDEGGRWACLDYSQQEPRWLVHYAELAGCTKAAEAAEQYRRDPKTDHHNMMATMINPDWPSITDKDLKKQERNGAKITFLGLCYGMGEAKLCRSQGFPTIDMVRTRRGKWLDKDDPRATAALRSGEGSTITVAGEEGRAFMVKFNAGVPFVKELADKAERVAAETGYIITAGGRRCRFPMGSSRHLKKFGISTVFEWVHKALNRLIQGTSGDQTKKAMVDADDAGVKLQLQVHDELDLTVWSDREVDDLSRIMLNALPCRVPHKVDAEVGPSWGEIAK